MARNAALQHSETHELALESLEFLHPQGLVSDERCALVELYHPAQACFERCGGVVDIIAVERVPHLETERVAGAEPDGLWPFRDR